MHRRLARSKRCERVALAERHELSYANLLPPRKFCCMQGRDSCYTEGVHDELWLSCCLTRLRVTLHA
jgi:hypothetical protein